GHGFAGCNVSGDVRHSAHSGLASAMAGDDHRPGAKDRPAASNFCWTARPRIAEEKSLATRQPSFSMGHASLEGTSNYRVQRELSIRAINNEYCEKSFIRSRSN